jgi:hypothetical protein
MELVRSGPAAKPYLWAGTGVTPRWSPPIGNMPLNAATLRAMTNLDPQLWTSTRRRWDRFHTARNLLNPAEVALLASAARAAEPNHRTRPKSKHVTLRRQRYSR